MKNGLCFILSFLLLIACTQKEELSESSDFPIELVGEWQLIEQRVSIGGPNATWEKVENGDTFSLEDDGTFSNIPIQENCKTGSFEATETELRLTYICPIETVTPIVNALFWENDDLILSPRTFLCRETCSYKYRKTGK